MLTLVKLPSIKNIEKNSEIMKLISEITEEEVEEKNVSSSHVNHVKEKPPQGLKRGFFK